MFGVFCFGNQKLKKLCAHSICLFATTLCLLRMFGCAEDLSDKYYVGDEKTDADSSSDDNPGTAVSPDTGGDTLTGSDTSKYVETDSESPTDTDADTETGSDFQTDSEGPTDTGADSDCDSASATDSDSTTEPENTPSACSDDADNDGDGLADCADLDCLSTAVCDCLEGSVNKEPCGTRCGEAEVICIDGMWSPPGTCQNEGTCEPGEALERGCEASCQSQTKTCEANCTWGDWGACEDIPGCTSCAGVLLDHHCWYLGTEGKSCLEFCGSHGGYSAATVQYVGTSDQGGSLQKCQALVNALGYTDEVEEGHRHDGKGLGCHTWPNQGFWWLTSPPFQPSFSSGTGRLVCACNE